VTDDTHAQICADLDRLVEIGAVEFWSFDGETFEVKLAEWVGTMAKLNPDAFWPQ